MPSAQSSVSVFALSVSWLWNTQMKCGFLAYISWEHVHSPAWEKPVKNIDLDRASASQTAAWRANRLTSCFWVYASVRGKIRFIPKGNINCIWLLSAVSDASKVYITECFYVQLHLSNTRLLTILPRSTLK